MNEQQKNLQQKQYKLLQSKDKDVIKQASLIALFSVLNLTFLPVISFIYLLIKYKQYQRTDLVSYHLSFAIKLNIIAGLALILVSAMVMYMGGINSAWTWVFVITYFVFVHTVFIVFAVWALIRSWSGNTVFNAKK